MCTHYNWKTKADDLTEAELRRMLRHLDEDGHDRYALTERGTLRALAELTGEPPLKTHGPSRYYVTVKTHEVRAAITKALRVREDEASKARTLAALRKSVDSAALDRRPPARIRIGAFTSESVG